jgi:hypothetical protein
MKSMSVFQKCNYFFLEKTQKTTLQHNAANPDFPWIYLLLKHFYTFWKKDLGVFYVIIL